MHLGQPRICWELSKFPLEGPREWLLDAFPVPRARWQPERPTQKQAGSLQGVSALRCTSLQAVVASFAVVGLAQVSLPGRHTAIPGGIPMLEPPR